MKRIIALTIALIAALSLTGCFGFGNTTTNTATSDEAAAGDISSYDKDFDGLVKYIIDSNPNGEKQEIYYDIVGADNGVRYIFNKNSYVEIYDYSKASSETAKSILADIKDDGKFRPLEHGTEMNGVITDSGKYVIAWDATRSYDYDKKVATEDVKANW